MNLNKKDTQVFWKLTEALTATIPKWFGSEAHFDAEQTLEARIHAHSFIIRYQIMLGKDERHLLVKIPHRPNQTDLQESLSNETLKQSARDEYKQLLTTWQAFEVLKDPDCTAVQPLDFLSDWNGIVMLEMQATPLRRMLLSPQVGFGLSDATESFIGYLRKAYRWLRYYHDKVGDSESVPLSQELMQARLDKISSDVANHIGNRYQVPAKLEILRSHIKTASGRERIARLHGDFHASNILITHQGKVCVLDPRVDLDKRSVYDDLSTLLIDLSVKPLPMLTRDLFTKKFLPRIHQTMVESYFKSGEFEPDLIDFYCACEAIFKWSMDERDFIRRKKMRMIAPLARPILTSYMQGLLRRYL